MSGHEILTMKEAIGYLKISERTLLKLIKEGKVRNLRVGNRYRFIKSELEEDLRADKHEVITR
jgi:excisionase family DNA binding protein